MYTIYKEYICVLCAGTTGTGDLNLKLKLTPFGIVHRSKGNPFQVCLTVSTDYIG